MGKHNTKGNYLQRKQKKYTAESQHYYSQKRNAVIRRQVKTATKANYGDQLVAPPPGFAAARQNFKDKMYFMLGGEPKWKPRAINPDHTHAHDHPKRVHTNVSTKHLPKKYL